MKPSSHTPARRYHRLAACLVIACVMAVTPPWLFPRLAHVEAQTVETLNEAVKKSQEAARAAEEKASEARKAADEVKVTVAEASRSVGRIELVANLLGTVGFILSAISFLALLLGGVAGIGFLPLVLRKLRAAISVAKNLDEQKLKLEEHASLLKNLQSEFDAALEKVRERFKKEPSSTLIGDDVQPAPQAAFDDDALIAFGDRLNLGAAKPELLAESLVLAGRYWRRQGDYRRAEQRLRRAIELAPHSASAHQNLGRALWNLVASQRVGRDDQPTGTQVGILDDADVHLDEAQKLRRIVENKKGDAPDLQGDLAAVLFCRAKWSAAKLAYAAAFDVSQVEAGLDHREPDWDLRYAVACAEAKLEQFEETFKVLEQLVKVQKSWDSELKLEVEVGNRYRSWMAREKDFDGMRKDTTRAERLERLAKL